MFTDSVAKLTHAHSRIVTWTSIAIAVTGVVWMAVHYGVAVWPEWDGPEVRSKLHLLIMVHGSVAYLGAVVLGTLLGRHLHAGLHARRRVLSGIAALVLAAVLIVTALLLYYAGGLVVRQAASVIHQISGVLAVAVIAAHILVKQHRGPHPHPPPAPNG